MRSADILEDDGGGLPTRAVVAALAALCAAALASGLLDRAPPLGHRHGRAAAVATALPAPAGGRGPAATAAPGPRMSFQGPGGEILDFPAAQPRP